MCKLLDYDKFRYEQSKKEKPVKRQQLSEVRLGVKISSHDLDTKIRSVQRMLSNGEQVKVLIRMKGREATHPTIAAGLLKKIVSEAQGKVIGTENLGQTISVTLIPGPIPG